MSAKEYVVWDESGGLISGPHRNRATAERAADKARAACAKICGTNGEDTDGRGNFACGVLSEHGIHIQITQDGRDVSHDPDY